jgi:methionyl-tRNA synthetase
MPKRYLVTAALPYSNNRLHVGHIAGAYLPADTYVRYLRAAGHEVCFICGSDDNGVAIEISALQSGSTPQAISSHYHARQQADFAGLGISFDIYGGTHQPDFQALHEEFSQSFFRRIHEKGFFTKKRTRQLFDPVAQRFLPDRYVRGTCHHCGAAGASGDQCDACGQMIDPLLLKDPISTITPGQPAEVRETTHWHLRLNDFERPLGEWLASKQGQWRTSVLNFALGQIKQGLPERSMTRDIEWGIPVPLDDPEAAGKVLFVWFDAPIGYISFTAALCRQQGDRAAYQRWWADPDCAIVHFIGEDNTVFHALTWPAMLMADGRFQLPSAVVANNYMNLRSGGELQKISKSHTSADSPVWIEEFLKRCAPDALRYYLTALAPETARTAFDPAEFIARNNNELVATFGNFVNRFMTAFATKHFGGRVPEATAPTDLDRALIARGDAALAKVARLIEQHQFRAGLEEVMAFAHACNEYFNARQPWETRKSDPAACATTIATCIHAAEYLAVLADPYLPHAAADLRTQLGIADRPVRWEAPPPPAAGRALGAPRILFAKLEPDVLG